MGIAVALEMQARRKSRGGTIDVGREPDLTGATPYFVRFRSRLVGQWRQSSPEFDHISIAVLPVIQEFEVRRILSIVMGRAASSAQCSPLLASAGRCAGSHVAFAGLRREVLLELALFIAEAVGIGRRGSSWP